MKILFLVIIIISIILGFITDKLTEGERKTSFVGPHIPFILLNIYKKNKNINYLVLFIFDIIFLILFPYQKTFSQDTTSLTKHWVRYSDCSIYTFNNIKYNGILLDGKKIYKQFPIISNAIYKITNQRIDSSNFIIVDSSIVIEFENKFSSLSESNDTILDRKCDDLQKYFRQYIAFVFQDKHYLLAGFTIPYRNELNKIISSRWFYFEHHKYFSCKQFYVLYNIENKIIDNILYKDPIN